MAAPTVASRSRGPRGTPDTDDAFYARALEFSAWGRKNARWIIGGAILSAVLIGALLYYRYTEADRRERAATEFMALESTAASGNSALATRDLERFIARFDGTSYADEARVLLGRLYLEAGQPQQAVAALGEVADDIDDSPVGVPAALLLATAQGAENPAAAIETYLRIGREAPLEFQRQEALASAAALREQTDDFAGAAELYQQLIDTAEEGSFQRSIFEMRLAEAQARAQ